MKYFKYFEEINNDLDDDFLLNMAKNAIRNNSIETLQFAIKQGLDLDKHKVSLIGYAESTVSNYDIIEHINIEKYNENSKELETLLYHSRSTKIEGIRSLKNLKSFNAVHHGDDVILEDISEIVYNQNLENVSLSNNRVKDISPLAKLSKIKTLHLGSNPDIKDYTPLQELPNLKILYINNNEIKDVSFLFNMKSTVLDFLNIEMNFIEDVTPLFSLKALEILDANYNKIKDVSILFGLENLKRLEVSDNQITTLEGVEKSSLVEDDDRSLGIQCRGNPLPEEVLKFVNQNQSYDDYDSLSGVKNYYTKKSNQLN